MTTIVVPHYIPFMKWAVTLFKDLPHLNIPIPESELKWKEWAETLLLDNDLVNVPLPQNFTDWRNWAEFFLENV